MENEMSPTVNFQPSIVERLVSAIVPVLFIAVGYFDPGKWAAAVEGGARFGYAVIILMLVFNFAAILCQYLSACIAVVTGRDLAQICSEEYDKITCIFLGIQAELSMIALDLAMILGTAHVLNQLLGLGLLTCVFLTSLDAVLYPVFSTFLDNRRAKLLCVCMTSVILLSYLFGVLVSQPEIPLAMSGTVLTKLSGESLVALVSLLGANVMPHNFYLHSSVVQQDQRQTNVSKGTLCHNHFLAITCIFSGIFLVNYVLMNSAANVFYSTDVLLTFQDALSLMDQDNSNQVFRSLMAPFPLILFLILSNHITALTWKLGGEVVLNNFFKTDIPGWLHHSTIRIVAIVPAFYCVYNSDQEGIYQLLIFTQIVVALSLPSSVIPLFRVASSRSIMGVHKVSQFIEFIVLITFLGMLGIEIIFVIEMVFGNSDWVSNLPSAGALHCILLITAFISFCLMLWLAATPLNSATTKLDAEVWNWDPQVSLAEPLVQREENDFTDRVDELKKSQEFEMRYHVDEFKRAQETDTRYQDVELKKIQEPVLTIEKQSQPDLLVPDSNLNLPDSLLDSDSGSKLSTIEEIESYSAAKCTILVEETRPSPSTVNEFSDSVSKSENTSKNESTETIVGKREKVEEDSQAQNDEADSWDIEEPPGVPEVGPTLTSDGPGSLRSLSGKSDDFGSGPASLSRLAGLGRAARRQLAAALDEFWGQLFDYHGKLTNEAKAKKLDMVLGIETNPNSKENPNPPSSLKLDPTATGYFPSTGGRVFDYLINASLYDFPRQQTSGPTVALDLPYVAQRGSSSLSSVNMSLLNAYRINPTQNTFDSGERRYSSLRLPHSSSGYPDQPAALISLDSGERRYSSLCLQPSSGGYGDQATTPNALDSGERRYSSLRLAPTSGSYGDQATTPNAIDSGERRYSSLRLAPTSGSYGDQPTTPNALDSGERRYSSLRLAPSSGSYGDHLAAPSALDSTDWRYSSLRLPATSDGYGNQPATIQGYQLQSCINRMSKESNTDYLTSQLDSVAPNSPSWVSSNYRDPFSAATLGPRKPQNGVAAASKPPGFPDLAVSRTNRTSGTGAGTDAGDNVNAKKYHSLPDISGLALPHREPLGRTVGGAPLRYSPSVGPTAYGQPLYSGNPYSLQMGPGSGRSSWSREPYEQFAVAEKASTTSQGAVSVSNADSESKLLQSFRHCIVKLSRLEGSDWLFRTNDGDDEDLIDRVAAREKFYHEAETRAMNQMGGGEIEVSKGFVGAGAKNEEMIDYNKFRVNSVPNCGDGCIWRVEVIISFGVWCIHRVLELSRMESRPELWGKYTYVLNRLQGIIEPAFSKPRTPMTPCFCLQVPAVQQQSSPPRITNGSLPPPSKQGRGKCTNAAMLLDIIKDVETAISCRKGRTGTAAGDVAFPKGKENLVSVLKRYKRRLSNKTNGVHEGTGSGPRRVLSAAYGS